MFTQQNSYSINYYAALWLDSDSVVTLVNYWQHSDYTAIVSLVTVLQAVVNGDFTMLHCDWTVTV